MKLFITALILLVVTLQEPPVLAEDPLSHLVPLQGEINLIPWKEVNVILPRKSIFTVVDVETGQSFQVQRRAGSHHADIQPLTNKDTEILKKIYPEWSWKRRAAIAIVDGKMIAASMNGMPHGAGALDNGFDGHFCLHFLNSTTHRSPNPDQAHHLMVLKAGGKIDDYLSKQSPEELIDVLMIAINNFDSSLLRKVVPLDYSEKDLNKLSRLSVTKWKVSESKTEQFVQNLYTRLEVYIHDTGVITTTIELKAKRDPITSRWRIEIPELLDIAKN